MDIVLLELVLWAGLICFLWVMKDSLGKIESELEKPSEAKEAASGAGRVAGQARPDRLSEPIGRLGDTTIYRYAVIDGRTYEFDYVDTGTGVRLEPDQRCIAPGIVYTERPNKDIPVGADA